MRTRLDSYTLALHNNELPDFRSILTRQQRFSRRQSSSSPPSFFLQFLVGRFIAAVRLLEPEVEHLEADVEVVRGKVPGGNDCLHSHKTP